MTDFDFQKKVLIKLLFDGKIDITFFNDQMARLQGNNLKRVQNSSHFVDVNRKPDTRGYRPAVISKKQKGNF